MAMDGATGKSPVGMFRDGTADGVYVEDLILGGNYVTTVGGLTGYVNVDGTSPEDGNGSSSSIEISSQKWGRQAWHRIILD